MCKILKRIGYILKWGAGAAQIVSNTKNPKLLAMAQAVFYDNYGDNPEDQVQIIKGIAYAQKLGLAPHENKSISPNFYTRIEEMPEHVTNINLYLKKIWDVIPANDVYYDQNHKFNHKKLMDLNSPENQQEYQSVLLKKIKEIDSRCLIFSLKYYIIFILNI